MNEIPDSLSPPRPAEEAAGRPVAVDRSQSESLALWIVLARATRAVQDLATEHAARHGLTLVEFGALEALSHKGPVLLGDLPQRILVSSGGATYLVDRLQERGLVERQEHPGDRRARRAVLTAKGAELMRGIFPEHAGVIDAAMRVIPLQERGHLREQIKSIGHNAAALRARPAPAPAAGPGTNAGGR